MVVSILFVQYVILVVYQFNIHIFLRSNYVKVRLSPSKKVVFIYFYFNESPLKMTKNAFYFMLKTFFVFEIFEFCPDLLVMQKNGFIIKLRSILKFITSQTGQ